MLMKLLSFSPRVLLALVGLFTATVAIFAAEPKQADPDNGPVTPPKVLKREPPKYPYNMRNAGLIGNVTIEFIIDEQGRVINPFVVDSNNPWFERPAIEAILLWKYIPAHKNGHAIKTRAQLPIRFDLVNEGRELWQPTKGKDHAKLPLEIRWDKCPEPIQSTYPIYPAEALVAGKKGHAVVRYLVNSQGRIETAMVIEASAPEFGGAAMASVDAWRFKPATRAKEPCAALVQMDYDFIPTGDASVPITSGLRDVVRELGRKEPRIEELAKLDVVPKALSRRPPVYPSSLRKAGQPGEALIEFCIDENGDAQLPRIVSASAPEFGYSAAQAVSTWRFEPPLKNGKPVIARVQIPVAFKSNENPKEEKVPAAKEQQP